MGFWFWSFADNVLRSCLHGGDYLQFTRTTDWRWRWHILCDVDPTWLKMNWIYLSNYLCLLVIMLKSCHYMSKSCPCSIWPSCSRCIHDCKFRLEIVQSEIKISRSGRRGLCSWNDGLQRHAVLQDGGN
jgi:hypothetical protein